MVNCNPETVSTDYDTSDRLYFEPLGVEEVLSICEREQPEGVVIQFGGQTPLKLARAIEAAGFRVLGTPFEAVDLAEDRERFAALCGELGIAVPPWGMASSPEEAVEVAERVGYPVLVRPSYVLGGRSMRVCYDAASVREAAAERRTAPRRPLPGERDRDRRRRALRRHRDATSAPSCSTSRRPGVHSGDSSCVLPPPSLTRSERRQVDARRAPARARPRRRRPAERPARARGRRALRAGGEPAGLAHRAVRQQGDRRESRAGSVPPRCGGHDRRPRHCPTAAASDQVSVKAAVLPFARFPGADPVLGPEMRSTGEVMASAGDLPTAFAKAERAAGRRLPSGGTAFLSVRDEDKEVVVPVAQALSGLGLPPARNRRDGPHARGRRPRGRVRAQGDRGGRGLDRRRPDPPRALRPRRQHAAGLGRTHRRVPDPRGSARRAGALHHDHLRRGGGGRGDRACPRRDRRQPAGTDRCSGAKRVGSSARRASGRTRSCAWSGEASTPGPRAASSCSRRRAGYCRAR